MPQRKEITGQRFGKLVAIEYAPRVLASGRKMPAWLMRCDCGAEVVAMTVNLFKGKHQSCGCERATNSRKTRIASRPKCRANDGKTPATKRPEYRIYRQMLDRCYLQTAPNYAWYGARGVRVCDRWRNGEGGLTGFESFFEDMGPRPKGLSLDRIDVDGDYGPGNCRWVNHRTQSRNKRNNRLVAAKGKTRTLAEWAEVSGISYSTLRDRLETGWHPDDAVSHDVIAAPDRHLGHWSV